MRLSNYLASIDWDLRSALIAKEKVNELFKARLQARDHAAEILEARQEDLREASIMRAEISQKIGELQEERFPNDEAWDDWRQYHQ